MTRLRMNQTQPAILKWLFSWPYGKSFSKADTAPVPITTANHAGVKCLVSAARQIMCLRRRSLTIAYRMRSGHDFHCSRGRSIGFGPFPVWHFSQEDIAAVDTKRGTCQSW